MCLILIDVENPYCLGVRVPLDGGVEAFWGGWGGGFPSFKICHLFWGGGVMRM